MTLLVIENTLLVAYTSNACVHFACLSNESCISDYSLCLPSQVRHVWNINNTGKVIVACVEGAYFVHIALNASENRLSVRCHQILLPRSHDIQIMPINSQYYLVSITKQQTENEMFILSLCSGSIDTTCPHTIVKRSRLLQQPIDKLVKCNEYIIALFYDASLYQSYIEIFDAQLTSLWTSEVMQSSAAPCCIAGPMNISYSRLHATHGAFTISLCSTGGSHVVSFVRDKCDGWKIINVFPVAGRVSGLYRASTNCVAVVYDHFLQLLHCCEGRKVEFRLGIPIPLVIDEKV